MVSWTGSFAARRQLLGVSLRWSYAPSEVKVLTSSDGGNFEEAVGWRQIGRSEPSFEESVMFATPVSAKAMKVLMRGPKPWGYFGLTAAAAVSAPYDFMLVSGVPAVRELCMVSSSRGFGAEPCLDAVVAGDGREVFTLTGPGQLQATSGDCVQVAAGKLELGECGGDGAWEVSADGQVKQGNMCLSVDGSAVHALDCDEAAALGSDRFYQAAVPEYDPAAGVAVRSLGGLLRASAARQGKLVSTLQAMLPKLASCKAKVSLASLSSPPSGVPATREFMSLASRRSAKSHTEAESLATKVGEKFGVSSPELASIVAASGEALAAFRKAAR